MACYRQGQQTRELGITIGRRAHQHGPDAASVP